MSNDKNIKNSVKNAESAKNSKNLSKSSKISQKSPNLSEKEGNKRKIRENSQKTAKNDDKMEKIVKISQKMMKNDEKTEKIEQISSKNEEKSSNFEEKSVKNDQKQIKYEENLSQNSSVVMKNQNTENDYFTSSKQETNEKTIPEIPNINITQKKEDKKSQIHKFQLSETKSKPIYLDNAGTTKVSRVAVTAINKILKNNWGNPSSNCYNGREANKILEKSRDVIKSAIGADGKDKLIFTSGGCESNTLAIKGFDDRNYFDFVMIADDLGHSSTRKALKATKYGDRYADFTIPCNSEGFIDINDLTRKCNIIQDEHYRPFVVILGANNEIGTIQDIGKIADIVHEHRGVLFVDAVQLFANEHINVNELDIDMMSISGHKIGCPAGIGALYVRDGIDISPVIYGSQEDGLRGGTENLAYIYAFAECVKKLEDKRGSVRKATQKIRGYFYTKLFNSLDEIVDLELVGSHDFDKRLDNNLSIMFKGYDARNILMYLDNHNICASGGSTCNSQKYEPSDVLTAIGLQDPEVYSVVRFSFEWGTKKKEVDRIIKILKEFFRLNSESSNDNSLLDDAKNKEVVKDGNIQADNSIEGGDIDVTL